MKDKILKKILITLITLTGIFTFGEVNEIKVKAEGWTSVNGSWRYYSGPSIQTGWYNEDGAWYYLDDFGMKKSGWIQSEGRWYYLDTRTGKMLTGWIQDKGNWYYLNGSGEMVTGWLEYNGNLYYLNTSGIMVKDIYVGSYYLGPDGAWVEGGHHRK